MLNKRILLTAVAVVLITVAGTLPAAHHNDPHSGSVMNYHRIDDRLVTGGHFVDDGLSEIKSEGVTVVIDLRDNPPKGQQKKLAEQGIEWINVPVEWDNPEAEDFKQFTKAMEAHQDDHVLVQCGANYRASAMTYLYRVVVEKVDEDDAAKDLYAVWTPSKESEEWVEYIDEIKASAN
jgi:protein tyrosine phosphatase (PTP) superfamily phosphohydrolase (DUF442 family)